MWSAELNEEARNSWSELWRLTDGMIVKLMPYFLASQQDIKIPFILRALLSGASPSRQLIRHYIHGRDIIHVHYNIALEKGFPLGRC